MKTAVRFLLIALAGAVAWLTSALLSSASDWWAFSPVATLATFAGFAAFVVGAAVFLALTARVVWRWTRS